MLPRRKTKEHAQLEGGKSREEGSGELTTSLPQPGRDSAAARHLDGTKGDRLERGMLAFGSAERRLHTYQVPRTAVLGAAGWTMFASGGDGRAAGREGGG